MAAIHPWLALPSWGMKKLNLPVIQHKTCHPVVLLTSLARGAAGPLMLSNLRITPLTPALSRKERGKDRLKSRQSPLPQGEGTFVDTKVHIGGARLRRNRRIPRQEMRAAAAFDHTLDQARHVQDQGDFPGAEDGGAADAAQRGEQSA